MILFFFVMLVCGGCSQDKTTTMLKNKQDWKLQKYLYYYCIIMEICMECRWNFILVIYIFFGKLFLFVVVVSLVFFSVPIYTCAFKLNFHHISLTLFFLMQIKINFISVRGKMHLKWHEF